MPSSLDCLIIGAGPAGLTAAIYLARFRLSVGVFDAGKSRAGLIPLTRNHAGFPGGISGRELVARMREQAIEYGAQLVDDTVVKLDKTDDGFAVHAQSGVFTARTVLIATGVTNRRPVMSEVLHAQALFEGRLRYCPICDGFEVTDQRVAVIGTGARGLKEALFLRSYTRDVTLAPNEGAHALSDTERRRAAEAGIQLLEAPASDIRLEADEIGFMAGGEFFQFKSIYPALGSDIHSGLAADVGADRTDEGCIKVDGHQRTTVPRLYAAGDVVVGLDQISHAMGEAGVAATTIRNDLAAAAPLFR